MFIKSHLILSCLILFSLSQIAFTAENKIVLKGFSQNQNWERSHSDYGLDVYTTKIPNSKLLGFKLSGVVDANIQPLMATLRNVERSAEWTPELLQKKTIQNISDNEAITYSLNNLPWPLSDRDFILHNKLFLSHDQKLLFVLSRSVKHKNYPENKNVVRAWIHYSNIGVRPIDNKRTYVEWTLFVDPRGNLPAWLVNFYQSRFPIKFFVMARNRANDVPVKLPFGMSSLLNKLNEILKSSK
ncbi:MAG: hypothetical protein HN576_08025 [Bacteriovoracaceae bacterium]|jgi:hypothetical protein|nr:hypothetical protein [Bacteriovoracaceae bacterium]